MAKRIIICACRNFMNTLDLLFFFIQMTMTKKLGQEESMVLEIKRAQYIKGYKIKLVFSDNKERTINFEPFLKQARNPMTRKFLDIDEFKKFKIEYGDLIWNDYEMCFPIIDLYEDKILKNRDMSSAA